MKKRNAIVAMGLALVGTSIQASERVAIEDLSFTGEKYLEERTDRDGNHFNDEADANTNYSGPNDQYHALDDYQRTGEYNRNTEYNRQQEYNRHNEHARQAEYNRHNEYARHREYDRHHEYHRNHQYTRTSNANGTGSEAETKSNYTFSWLMGERGPSEPPRPNIAEDLE